MHGAIKMTSKSSYTLHLPYIDCIRGYAVSLVIISHTVYLFPDLPYPVQRVLVNGWFGVQLFFLASCVTLLQSWNKEIERYGFVSVQYFFMRRIFRIAPAYYLAALAYAALDWHSSRFSSGDVITTLVFANALHPVWALTNHVIVPGGWSIGAEFAFYAVFPVFAVFLTSLRRALLIFAGSLMFGWAANLLAMRYLIGDIPIEQFANGLFFWFPNQASVFALGGVIYFILKRPPQIISYHPNAGVMVSLIGFWLLGYLPSSHYLGETIALPDSLTISLVFAIGIISLSVARGIFVNRTAAAFGRVSFSAYLIHFGVLDIVRSFPQAGYASATGYQAIVAYTIALMFILVVTYGLSCITFRWIERPMINFSAHLSRQRHHHPT